MNHPNLPRHLSQNHATGVTLNEPIAQFEIGSMQNFIYLILDWSTQTCAIVDPQKNLEQPLRAISEHGFKLTTILLTHSHFDHTAGVVPLLEQFPDLEVRVGERDLHRLPKSVTNLKTLSLFSDGEIFSVGKVSIQALATPGHSAGAFSFYLEKQAGITEPYLFTGDTIFIRDCGRTDLDTGSNDEMFASVQRVKKLPPETIFLVGHHYAEECGTTLADELGRSPPFQVNSVEELAGLP